MQYALKQNTNNYSETPSRASMGGDSYSSLNHSYETLNMSDTAESVLVATSATSTAGASTSTQPRLPHRPAPPIPSLLPKMLMTAKEREYLQVKSLRYLFYYRPKNIADILVIETQSIICNVIL